MLVSMDLISCTTNTHNIQHIYVKMQEYIYMVDIRTLLLVKHSETKKKIPHLLGSVILRISID